MACGRWRRSLAYKLCREREREANKYRRTSNSIASTATTILQGYRWHQFCKARNWSGSLSHPQHATCYLSSETTRTANPYSKIEKNLLRGTLQLKCEFDAFEDSNEFSRVFRPAKNFFSWSQTEAIPERRGQKRKLAEKNTQGGTQEANNTCQDGDRGVACRLIMCRGGVTKLRKIETAHWFWIFRGSPIPRA